MLMTFLFQCCIISLFVIHYAVAIQKFSGCPPAALRGLIAKNTCPRAPEHYHCLETVQSKDFLQICIKQERIEKGQYPVFKDSTAKFIFPKKCASSRYQPKAMFTYERNECWYEKSSCMEEGQIVFSNGSATDDRTCRCDYTKGYAFISTPVNKCYCVPSKEDCSCYKKECLQKVEVLNADYMCSTVKFNETCPDINSTEYPYIPKKKINNTDINSFLFNNQGRKNLKLLIATFIVLIILLPTIYIIWYEYVERMSSCMLSILNQLRSGYEYVERMSSCMLSILNQLRSELKITEELKNIKFEESNSVLFECTVSKKKSQATWLKDGKQIQTSDMSYVCQSEANIHSLKIEKANLQNVGTYTVIIEDKFSSATLFKEEESLQPQSVPSMENKDADSGEIVDLQRKEEHIDDDEHLPAVKKDLMGNTMPLPSEQGHIPTL